MKRREAVKQFFVLAGGILIASSCDFSGKDASIKLTSIKLSSTDEEVLARLSEMIIPESDSPGAINLKLHLFLMKMVDDCQSPDDQKQFLEGLKELKAADDGTAEALLTFWTSRPEDDSFSKIVKSRVIQGVFKFSVCNDTEIEI